MRLLLPTVTTIVVLAGCGGSGGGKLYALLPSQSCAQGIGTVDNQRDVVADDATEGAFRVVIDGNEAMVAFGKNDDEGRSLADSYSGVPGMTVERHSNAVIAWTDPPTDTSETAVSDCLKE